MSGLRHAFHLLVALLLGGVLSGCALLGSHRPPQVDALRISEQVSEGDAARRASTRLVVDGLDADSAGLSERALSNYERAIQVDPTNPYAFLALARFYADSDQPARASTLIERSEGLFQSQGTLDPGVAVQIEGLRAQVEWKRNATPESARTLDRAARISPEVWGDGVLSSRELR